MAAYGMTKAAALIAATKWAVKLQDEGFIVVSVSPGLVDTSGTIGENGEFPLSRREDRTGELIGVSHNHT